MPSCKICRSSFHNALDCNLLESYLTIIGVIFTDYRTDHHKENLQKRLHEITKNWKLDLWFEVAKKFHNKIGAYVSENTPILFLRHLQCTIKSSYVASLCEYYYFLEYYMDEESIESSSLSSTFQYELIMIENNNAWFHKEICGICLEQNQENKIVGLQCHHTYCTSCIIQFINNQIKNCPICREKMAKIYFCSDIHWEEFNKIHKAILK